MKLFRILFSLALLLPLLASAADAPTEERGVGVGQDIPHMLVTQDQTGAITSFDKLVGPKGMILIFTRSVDWCPFCQKQLKQWNDEYAFFKEKGYTIVGITHEPAETIAKFHSKAAIQYPILSDADGAKITKAFDILNEEFEPSHRFYGVPHPTLYVINRDARIIHRYAEEGYRARPDIHLIKREMFGE